MLGYLATDIICSEKGTVFRKENCELRGTDNRGTDNGQGQISEHIFAPNGDYCIILQIFYATRTVLKIGVCS